jgi:hypothetical protein
MPSSADSLGVCELGEQKFDQTQARKCLCCIQQADGPEASL